MSKRKGFTLIEVILFLAVTTMIFAGVIVGVQTSLSQQRFNDITQNFYEFARSWYSKVANPQSTGKGTSNMVLYGKLIVFGQQYDLQGKFVYYNDRKSVYVYDVAASEVSAESASSSNKIPNLYLTRKSGGKALSYGVEEYHPRWGAMIRDTDGWPFTGSILIARNMSTGVINTFVTNDIIEVNKSIMNNETLIFKNVGTFSPSEINFCIDPNETGASQALPQNIRITGNARNASEVILIDTDNSENKCKR